MGRFRRAARVGYGFTGSEPSIHPRCVEPRQHRHWRRAFAIALAVFLSIKVAAQWELVVILRLGKFRALENLGPMTSRKAVFEAHPRWKNQKPVSGTRSPFGANRAPITER